MALSNIILCQKIGITLEEANHYRQMSRLLERIGDHAVKIAKNILKIIPQGLKKELINKILETSEMSLEILKKSQDAWYLKDIILANNNIELVKELNSECEKLLLNPNNDDLDVSIAISYIIESIRRTGEYARDISEIIINNLI